MARKSGQDTGASIAHALGLSHRRVQTLFNEGMPRTKDEAVAWYQARKVARETARSKTLDEARRRKTEAEAELAEIELAKARGEVVTVAEVTEEVGRTFDRLRATVLAMPGKWTPQIVGVPDLPAAKAMMDAMANELLESLSTADDSSDDT